MKPIKAWAVTTNDGRIVVSETTRRFNIFPTRGQATPPQIYSGDRIVRVEIREVPKGKTR